MQTISSKPNLKLNLTVSRCIFGIVAVVGVTFVAGCATFQSLGGRPNVPADPSKIYTVEMGNMMGRPSVYQGVTDGTTTVQKALEESGAIRKFRNMDIVVMRPVEGTGQPLKMVCKYMPAKKMVSPEQDYALLPGDYVIVEAASVSITDRLMGK